MFQGRPVIAVTPLYDPERQAAWVYQNYLDSLEEQGAVESYEQCVENGRKRKYYHLTKGGGKLLKSKQQEWQEYERAVRNVLKGGVGFAG